jgi:HAD superfamily hydrolase (TIGR01490 family)
MRPSPNGAAFFDVDKTLLPGTSTEMLLVKALLRGRLPGRFRLFPFLAEALRLLPKGPTLMRKANKAFLAGATPEEVRAWGERLFTETIGPRLEGDPGREWVEAERCRGRAIVLLTGMPELLLPPFVRHFGADIGIATPLDVDAHGRLTGGHEGVHPYGEAKLELARRLCEQHGWDPRVCSAYGDHATDAFLLEWVGEAVAVDPDDGLRAIALERGWRVLDRRPR